MPSVWWVHNVASNHVRVQQNWRQTIVSCDGLGRRSNRGVTCSFARLSYNPYATRVDSLTAAELNAPERTRVSVARCCVSSRLSVWQQQERDTLTFIYTKEDPVASSDPDKVRYIRARASVPSCPRQPSLGSSAETETAVTGNSVGTVDERRQLHTVVLWRVQVLVHHTQGTIVAEAFRSSRLTSHCVVTVPGQASRGSQAVLRLCRACASCLQNRR
jgi:hypothetical protein